jgi:AAA+ superfamily predicted ATPase
MKKNYNVTKMEGTYMNKRRIMAALLLTLSLCNTDAIKAGGQFAAAGGQFAELLATTGQWFAERAEAAVQRLEARMRAIDDERNHLTGLRANGRPLTDWQAARLVQLERDYEDMRNMRNQASGLVLNAANTALETLGTIATTNARRQTEVEIAAVNASINSRAFYDAITNPRNLMKGAATLTAVAIGFFAAKEFSKVAANYVEARLGKPKLVKESSRLSFFEEAKNAITGKQPRKARMNDIKVDPVINEKLKRIAYTAKNAYSNGDPMMNVLFYGPPGVGKTMYAKELAHFAGLEFAMMSGADFSQFKEGDDITELHKLFDWADNSEKGLLVFIDEAEAFLANRFSEKTSERTKKVVQAFLSRIEKQSNNKIMFVFATNFAPRTNVLDPAVLSRIAPGNRIEFMLPGAQERADILDLYITKYIRAKKIAVDLAISENKDALVALMNGMSGRDIDGAVALMVRELRMNKSKTLTYDVVTKVLQETAQEKAKDAQPIAA